MLIGSQWGDYQYENSDGKIQLSYRFVFYGVTNLLNHLFM